MDPGKLHLVENRPFSLLTAFQPSRLTTTVLTALSSFFAAHSHTQNITTASTVLFLPSKPALLFGQYGWRNQ